jgi:hypothetical protein
MMLDLIPTRLEDLLQSRALPYLLAGVLILIWSGVSAIVSVLRRGRREAEVRPRRRLPLH